jgi:citrate lyase synthetase
MENLDVRCAEFGKQLSELGLEEKLITEALSALEEQGVYAFFLFLNARGKNAGKEASKQCADFLSKIPQVGPLLKNGKQDLFARIRTLAENLDDLLFARDLLHQALVYARYHLKARGGG